MSDGEHLLRDGGSTRAWRELREEVLERDGRTCHYCGKAGATHVDHKRARAAGGTDSKRNLVAACQGCNLGKGTGRLRRGLSRARS